MTAPFSPMTIIDRIVQAGAFAYKIAFGNDADTEYPDFAVDGGYSQTKTLAKSLLMGDPGDTPELGFKTCGGNMTTPAAWTGAYQGAYVYNWPMDNTGNHMAQQPTGFSSYLYLGRSVEVSYAQTATPTPTDRRGAYVVATCPPNHRTPFQRFWVSDKGNAVFAGRSSYEDGSVTYPDNPSSLGLPVNKYNAPAFSNYADTQGWANVSIPSSHKTSNGAIAIRKGSNVAYGFDWKHDHTNDRLEQHAVVNNVSTCISYTTSDGKQMFGQSNYSAPLGTYHFAANDVKFVFEDTGGSPCKTMSFRCADGAFTIRNETDGYDTFRMTAAGDAVVGIINYTLPTNATGGFLRIPYCNGTPTGTPTTEGSTVPLVWDHTNKKLYVYDGAWNAMN